MDSNYDRTIRIRCVSHTVLLDDKACCTLFDGPVDKIVPVETFTY